MSCPIQELIIPRKGYDFYRSTNIIYMDFEATSKKLARKYNLLNIKVNNRLSIMCVYRFVDIMHVFKYFFDEKIYVSCSFFFVFCSLPFFLV